MVRTPFRNCNSNYLSYLCIWLVSVLPVILKANHRANNLAIIYPN